MSHICELTGKKRLRGNRVSHANNKTIHYQQPNLQERRIYIPELGRKIKMKVSTSALRTIDKFGGISNFLLKANPEILSPDMLKIKKQLMKKGLS